MPIMHTFIYLSGYLIQNEGVLHMLLQVPTFDHIAFINNK